MNNLDYSTTSPKIYKPFDYLVKWLNSKNALRKLIFLTTVILLSGCTQHNLFSDKRILMSTVVQIKVVADNKIKAEEVMNFAFERIKRIESLMNRFDANSELSKLNASSKNTPIKISDELFYCINTALEFSRLSGGAFDITVEPLMELWKKSEENQIFPLDSEIKQALSCVGYKNIQLDNKNKSVLFLSDGIKIDLGGIAKGYAADEAIRVLKQQGIKQALVNMGGNIYCLGKAPTREYWSLGLQNPSKKDKIIGTIQLKDRAISTSGSYERFFSIKEKRFSHIINPKTGYPCQDLLSVTVVAESAIEADALSTAVFVLGKEDGMRLIKQLKNVGAIIITKNQTGQKLDIWISDGLRENVKFYEAQYNRMW